LPPKRSERYKLVLSDSFLLPSFLGCYSALFFHPITFCVPDVSDKLEFAAQKPWRYFLSLFQNLLQCKISIALIKLHKAKTSQSILGVSTSSIASIIIAIPQRIPIIPLINLITFST
ncbi:MAG: hypothetical protein IJD13_01620, partial [Oscillospiraceae bacterium]|nr:hypothetical protein [Oscillospiraceae bacterium]